MKRRNVDNLRDEFAGMFLIGKISPEKYCEIMDICNELEAEVNNNEQEEFYDYPIDYEIVYRALDNGEIPKVVIEDICDVLKNAGIIE